MRKGTKLLLSCLGLALASCTGPKSYGPAAYLRYVEDPGHEYRVKQEIGDKEYTIQLAPPEYLISKESEEHKDSLSGFVSRRRAELKGYMFFLVRMGHTEQSRREQGGKLQSEQQANVNSMVAYYDQQAAADISLQSGNRTLSPSTYVFENNYGLSPYNTIVVGFEVGEPLTELTLNFNDRYNNIPSIRAGFSKETLDKLPTLSL
ncbi:MAG: hypothetical protein JNL13_06315 [Chitinophagaceae bacterium]|nr:hypothetical protein [Chitinophagaceae bacterium]